MAFLICFQLFTEIITLNPINSQKEEQWGEEASMIWMNGRSSLFKRIRRFIDSYVVWTLWMSIGVRNLNFRLSLLRRWPFSIWSLIHLNELRYSFSFDGLRLMNHNEFIRWETVMFSVLCIYEIHRNFRNSMFSMVFDVLFSVRKPSSQSIGWINKSFRLNNLQLFFDFD